MSPIDPSNRPPASPPSVHSGAGETIPPPGVTARLAGETIRIQALAEDGFRFVHVLVHDAVYRSIPKERRAQLHERFSAWLDGIFPPHARVPKGGSLSANYLVTGIKAGG